MKRPIKFREEFIELILSGRKTQTRRPVKPSNSTVLGSPGRELWTHLHFDHPGPSGLGVRVDGPNSTIFGCGPGVQYLHVPAWHPEDGPNNPVVYRVRPVVTLGDRFEIKSRGASPALIEVARVRAEQVNAITEADAIAEGCLDGGCLNCGESSYSVPCGCANPEPDHRDAFAFAWNRIYGGSAFEWHANPWVWVYEFRVAID